MVSIIVLLAGIAMYALAGFLVAPRILKDWIETAIATEPGQRLAVEGVYVNPFTLFVVLSNVTLIDDKNKATISAASMETRLWALEKFRRKESGRDAIISELRIYEPSTGELILAAPRLSVTGLVVNAEKGSIAVTAARLENADLRIVRNAAGEFRLPAGLPLPGNDASGGAVRFEELDVINAQIRYTDHVLSPPLQLEAGDIAGTITRQGVSPATSVALEFTGHFGESGSGGANAEWRPGDPRAPATVDLHLRQVELPVVSRYLERIAGRGIAAGTGDMTLHYERRDSVVRIDNRISVEGLRLDEGIPMGIDTKLPLAVALLTDEMDHIDISVPVVLTGIETDFTPLKLIVDGTLDYVTALVARPFESLAVLMGQEDEDLGSFAFAAGSAEVTPATMAKLELLARALKRRPLLALRARPAYEPAADRDAIAAEQVRLHVRLATSASAFGPTTLTPLDFNDPKVRIILDEFAGARLRQSQRMAISNRFSDNDANYYESVYDALVANETISETVLRRLARFRARSVVDALRKAGVDEKRLLLAEEIDASVLGPDKIVVRLEVVNPDEIATQARLASKSIAVAPAAVGAPFNSPIGAAACCSY